jgi:hypothetical protein
MRPDPADPSPIFFAAVICLMLAVIAVLAPGGRALSAISRSLDADAGAWPAWQAWALPLQVGDEPLNSRRIN